MTHYFLILCGLLLGGLSIADDAADKQFDFAQGAYIQQDYLTAIEEFRTFLKQFPKDAKAAAAHFSMARAYLRMEQFKEAAEAYSAALTAYPDDPEAAQAHFDLGRARSALSQPEEALPHYAYAATHGEGELREEAMVGQGESLIALERYEDAAALYKTFLDAYPESTHRPNILFTNGWVLHQAGKDAKAIAVLQQLIAKYPDYPQLDKARLLLSDASSATGNYDQAAAALQALITDETQGAAATLRLGWTVYRQGKKAEAAGIFADFAKRYPDHEQAPAALYNAAVAQYEGRLFAEAAATCEQLQKAYPEAPASQESRLWQGLSLYEAKAYEQTIAVLEPLLTGSTLSAEHAASARYAVAAAHSVLGQNEQAIRHYRALLKEYPESAYTANASYSLARLVGESGNREEAVTLLRGMLAASPPQNLADLGHFALGEHLFFLEQYPAALEQLQACKLTGDEADKVTLRLGWTLFKLGQFSQALEQFERLANGSSTFAAEAAYMAGQSAEEAGDAERAKALYTALSAKVDSPFAEKAHYALVFLLDGDAAAASIELYLKRFPQGVHTTDLLLKLAELELAADQLDAAEARYQALTKGTLTDSQRRTAYYGLGWCFFKREDLEKADAAFAQVTNPPADTMAQDARQQRGEIAFRQERYAEALALFSDIAELETPRAERALYMVGWCNRHLGKTVESEAAFRRQLERFPKGDLAGDGWLRLAESLHERGENTAASEALDKAREQVKPSEDLLQLQGEVLVALEAWRRLIDQSKELKAAYPDSKRAFLADFRLGLAYRAAGLLDDAETCFQATIAATNTIEAAKAQFNIGTLYMSRKQPLEAGKQFLRVELLYDYPDLSPKALYHATAAFVEAEGAESRRAGIYRDKLKKDYAASDWATKVDSLFTKSAEGATP